MADTDDITDAPVSEPITEAEELDSRKVGRILAAVATESARTRPAVVVSNDGANTIAALLGQGVVTVVPVTSNTEVIHPFQVMLTASNTGLRLDSKAQVEQIRSVDVKRIGGMVGLVPLDLMAQIEDAMRLHLEL